MLLIASWIAFIFLTILLIGATLYVLGLLIGPVFGAPFVPSSQKFVEDMVRLSGIRQGQCSVDLGCGDGRLVAAFAAAGAQASGYEINPMLVWFSRLNMIGRHHRGSSDIILGNFVNHDLSRFDVITTYLMPPMMAILEKKLIKEMKPGARVVSNSFSFPNWKPIMQEGRLFVYEKTLDQTISEADSRLA